MKFSSSFAGGGGTKTPPIGMCGGIALPIVPAIARFIALTLTVAPMIGA
ncbi:MAG: hypothetical protein KFB96_01010 [Thiocapsa sp.]|nr:hypothetical protein [Thiocapsa sp.]QVL49148.1 MAG: hypothetical protein KFB96_01010 [Thiocapsa sp.]